MLITTLAVVEARAVSLHYHLAAEVVRAVSGVSLGVNPGQFVLIRGRSGCGKSSLLRLLSAQECATEGDVTIAGRSIRGLGEDARSRLRLEHVGFVFQDAELIDEFTVAENVAFPMELRRLPRFRVDQEVSSHLADVGLGGLGDRLPHQLSGGQRQRAGIARALAGGRRIVIADEPTGSLDSVRSGEILQLLRSLCDRRDVAVVMASHDPSAVSYADRVLTMRDGTVHEESP